MLAVFDDILDDIETRGALTQKPATGDEPLLILFPELSEVEVTQYIGSDNTLHDDPFDDKIVGEPEQLSVRRRSELKPLVEVNGWIREEVDSKRRRFTYKSPDKLTTVTSLKEAMKAITSRK
eukprot:794289-Prymnesium_polylepis.1